MNPTRKSPDVMVRDGTVYVTNWSNALSLPDMRSIVPAENIEIEELPDGFVAEITVSGVFTGSPSARVRK